MSKGLTVGLWKTGELVLDFSNPIDIEGALVIARDDRDIILQVLGMCAPEYKAPDWNNGATDDEKMEKAIEFAELVKHGVSMLRGGDQK